MYRAGCAEIKWLIESSVRIKFKAQSADTHTPTLLSMCTVL